MSLSQIAFHLLVVFVTGKGKLTGTEEPVVSDSDASQTDGQNMVSRICIMCSLAHLWAV